ncbi:hypothetical protein Cfor_10881 [Coptotermes formosanus]|uniref:Carboxylesterase type B domain-containing protein n=1 Tax=Coptotermes formosanus TaxID=36987 RepID=A0A6L2PE21_COPFO|nr:hypothetical protein Cfor_10881 [Coptotermes formosanus]
MGSTLACILLLFCLSAAGGSTSENIAEGNAHEINVEGSKHDVKAGVNTPNVNTEESVPEVSLEEDTFGVHEERSIPEKTVGKNIPEVNTDKSTPEVSVEGNTPEFSPKNTPEENTGKDTHGTTTEESNPEVGVEGSTPEVTIQESDPEVSTVEGKLQGTILHTHKGKIIYAFLGIPYASPPTDKLRFMTPQSVKQWDGVRTAKEEGQSCPQLTYPERKYEGSEDCLYLNVYTTMIQNTTNLETSNKDVFVVLHDGGFSHGSGDIANYGPDYLLDHDVVMVTCNYRLGALGFLATGDESASGNYGLKDQVNVLRWVRRNINSFSGNPNSVTLFGAGAGAASVHYHMLSGLSRGLFHRAISQSGTALSPWASVRGTTARERAFKLGNLLGCKNKALEDTEQLIKCIRRKPAKEVVEASTKILEYAPGFSYPFVPVEDEVVPINKKPLLHDRPINIMKKPLRPALWEIPWLVGVTSHEGLPQSLQVMVYQDLKENLDTDPAKNVLKYLAFDIQPEEKAREVGQKIWQYYLKNDTISYGTNLVKLAEMTSHFNYYYGLSKSVNTLVNVSDTPIFVYYFSYNRRDARFSLGVPHGDDTLYMFPNIIAGTKLVTDEKHFHVTERLLRIVTNFAQNGDPTPEETPELNDILWPVIEPDNFQYVDIGKKLTIKKDFFPEHMAFWDSIFKIVQETPNLVKDEL